MVSALTLGLEPVKTLETKLSGYVLTSQLCWVACALLSTPAYHEAWLSFLSVQAIAPRIEPQADAVGGFLCSEVSVMSSPSGLQLVTSR